MGWLDDAFRDIGNAVGAVANGFVSLGDSVLGSGAAILQGGGLPAVGEKLAKRANQALGSGLTIATGGVLETDLFQRLGDDKTVDRLTLGLSGDFAGAGRLFRDARARNDLRQEDMDDFFRGGAKIVGAIGTAGYIGASNMGFGITEGGAAAAEGGSGWLTLANAKDAAFIGGLASAAQRGDTSSFLSQITGEKIPDWVNNIAPQLPQQPGRAPQSQPGPTVAAPQVSSPWQFADNGIGSSSKGGIDPVILASGAALLILGAVVIARKK